MSASGGGGGTTGRRPPRRYNRYQDVEMDAADLMPPGGDVNGFLLKLGDEERRWKYGAASSSSRSRNSALFWLRVPARLAHLLTHLLTQDRFAMHHACQEYVMLVRGAERLWPASIPSYGTHYSRVECVVLDPVSMNLLVVHEASAADDAAAGPAKCKLVTGSIELGEHPSEAAAREVMEETHIRARFVGLAGIVSRTCTRFGRDELIVGCAMIADPPGQTPQACSEEIRSAQWVPAAEVTKGACGRMAAEWASAAWPTYAAWRIAGDGGAVSAERAVPDFRGGRHTMRMYSVALPNPPAPVSTGQSQPQKPEEVVNVGPQDVAL